MVAKVELAERIANRRKEMLMDIAALAGGRAITEDLGAIESTILADLSRAHPTPVVTSASLDLAPEER
jgi:hypothetical protein